MPPIAYWPFLGILNLLILTYQDYRHNMMVDDRKNYLMLGCSLALYSHFNPPIYYILAIVAMVFGLNIFLNRYKLLGEADVSTVTWMFLGFAIISPWKLAAFVIIFSTIMLIYTVLKAYVFKFTGKMPLYPVLLLIFVTSVFFTGVL